MVIGHCRDLAIQPCQMSLVEHFEDPVGAVAVVGEIALKE